MPLLSATPPNPHLADGQTVFDGLAFMQAPINITRLAELLADHTTTRGSKFHGPELRQRLQELHQSGAVLNTAQGQWWAEPRASWLRFAELVRQPEACARWWASWRRLHRFDHSWHLELFGEEAMVGALRVVVFAGGTPEAFERLNLLSRSVSPDNPALLRAALLRPFDVDLWERIDPELQYRLLLGLLNNLGGDIEAQTLPLWRWLQARSQPDPGVLHDRPRLRLAERLVLAGQAGEARRVLMGLDHPEAQALRAAADIAEGRYASGAAAFELAWKEAGALAGKRKQLFPDTTSWFYALALIAQAEPAAWTKARKFSAGEAGKRDPDPYTFWGLWQEAIDQRLGDAPRSAQRFAFAPMAHGRLHGLQQLDHWLLAAWLGHSPPMPEAFRPHAAALAQAYDDAGLPWLAAMARRAAALLLGEEPGAADARLAFPVGAPVDRWREALNAIVALGPVGGAAAAPGGAAQADRLVWTVQTDALGRVRRIEPWEQKAGTRGLGKPKPASLTSLSKRADLPAHDAAVLRALRKLPFGGKLALDKQQAVQALVRHPHVAWHDAPQQFIEVVESLPQLEVLTRGEHLQFRVLDPIRPEPAAAAAAAAMPDDDEGEDEDWAQEQSQRRSGVETSRPSVLLLHDGPERARLVRITPAQLRVAELVSQGWQVPVAARQELDEALRVLGTHFQLASDAEAGHEVAASAVLRAELTPQGDGLSLRLVAAPFGDFGPRLAPGLGRERVTTVHQGLTLSTKRLLADERAHLAALTQSVDWLDDGDHAWALDEPDQALAVVEALGKLATTIVSEWPKGKPMRVRAVTAPQVKLNVSSQGDWLAIDGELNLDGGEVIRLRDLLDRLHTSRSRYVALGDGGFLALTDTLRQQLADLKAITQAQGKGQRISTIAALAWAAQADAPALTGDHRWQQRCQAWEAAQGQVFERPASLLAELRDYQASGWQWMMRLAASGFGAVLADDMGLGKTLQTLALLAARASGGPALVVAPTSVCGNWLAEAARFAPGLRVELYGDTGTLAEASDDADDGPPGTDGTPGATGPDTAADSHAPPADSARQAARRKQVQALGAGQVLVCSYGLLQLDGDLLGGRHWHTAVLDEAQAIKNAGTRRARAAQALAADFKLALTGTPIENRLAELWSIMAFANPGLLGSAEQFNQRFAGPIERDGDPQVGRRLRRLVAPFLLRRTKAEVLADLPARTEIVHEVVPGPRERALLEALRQQAEESVNQALAAATGTGAGGGPGEGQAQMHILAALTKLRRAACDPRLVAPELGLVGAKVQEFERLAQELVAGRHKALVFSQFTDFLGLLRERLDAAGLRYQYLDGSTPMAQRSQRVNAFQAGEGDFFLISLKAGGFGLNLTMADYVIIADPWWNPAAEDQASGRAHRIGQQRPVTVYRLVTQGSIEDRIVKLHHSKRALAEGVLAGQDGGGGTVLGAAQMLALLRGEEGNSNTDADTDADTPTDKEA
jgi:superfamily II DNA or RNA helicase